VRLHGGTKLGGPAATILIALAMLAALSPAGGASAYDASGTDSDTGTASAGISYDPAGTYAGPGGTSPTNWYNRPNLAAARVWDPADGRYVMRMFRTVARSSHDSSALSTINNQNAWMNVGDPSGWHLSSYDALGNRASVANFVQSGSTLYSFDIIARNKEGRIGPTIFYTPRRTSTDGGKHWTLSWAKIDMGTGWCPASAQVYSYQGVIKLADGTWVMPVYFGHFGCPGSTPRMATGLLTSTDLGKTWKKSAVPFNSTTVSYDEASVVQRSDGRLAMVARYEYSTDWKHGANMLGALTFRISRAPIRSKADFAGATWSAPHITVPNSPLYANTLTIGASPKFTKVGSRMMLTYGRPGNHVTWNSDGTATTWSSAVNLNPNAPYGTPSCRFDKDTTTSHPPCQALGTSGYMAAVAIDGSAGWGYIMGDACHVWSCEIPGTSSYADNWTDVAWKSGGANQKVWIVRFRSS